MILIKMNLGCNFRCEYCYQRMLREKKIDRKEWDLEAVKNTIKNISNSSKEQIVLHGGEPLTLPIEQIEELLKLSYDLTGRSGIQTNGYLINDDVIELFKKYKTSVGLSIDGPFPCNELRGIGDMKERKKQTATIINNLMRLNEENVPVSVITVVHKKNAIGERRELLKYFILDLHNKKIGGRLNICHSGNPEIDLTTDEAKDFYLDMLDFMIDNEIIGWSPFRDIINSLTGKQDVVCLFRSCNPLCTPSCKTVLYDGSVGVCIRLYNKGEVYLRSESSRNIRDEILQQTDCKDCKWWNHCYGGCPGMAIDGDWRNKDRNCEVYKALFERLSKITRFIGIRSPCVKSKSLKKEFGESHLDGVEHIDGGYRHLDSNYLPKGSSNHSDGIEHLDGNLKHLDSDLRW